LVGKTITLAGGKWTYLYTSKIKK